MGFGGFEETFEIRKVSRAEGSPVWQAELGFRESRMAVAVMKVVLRVNGETNVPVEFRLEFRDGTKIGWMFGDVKTGGEIGGEVFEFDLEGYEIKES